MIRLLLFVLLIGLVAVAAVQLTAGFREELAESRYPAEGEIVEVGGLRIHAEVHGNGPDLVLLHGASGNARDFTLSLVEALKDRYRVIVFDRPGHGWTRRPEGFGGAWNTEGESPRLQARLLRQAAVQLGVERPLVLGHSYGGAVAMAWALDHPDTAGLVMVGAVSHPWPGELDWNYPVIASAPGGALLAPLITAFTPGAYVEGALSSLFAPQVVPEQYMEKIGIGLILRRNAQRANARQVNALRPFVVEMSEDYPGLALPIEIVHGDADTIVPLEVHSRPLAERVESAKLTVLEGVGHMPHHVAQAEVIAAIDRAASRAGLR